MPAPRRLVILAEGQLTFHDAKTAFGVIRYGLDPVVALVDSTNAGRNVREWLGPEHDVPIVATLAEALPLGPTALVWRNALLHSMAQERQLGS